LLFVFIPKINLKIRYNQIIIPELVAAAPCAVGWQNVMEFLKYNSF